MAYANGFAALADPTRREIFERLAARPSAVGELATALPVSRPAVSQHLRILKEAGLVVGRRAGNRNIYQLNPAGLRAMRAYLEQLWTQALAIFTAAVEREPQAGRMPVLRATATVCESVVVEASVERAFSAFTDGIGSWWPEERHILTSELAEMVFESHQGGHVYDRGTDGSESRWGRVLAYEPPDRVLFSWDISLDWQIEPDPAKTSEVEVRFIPETPCRTRVELEHRRIERHGEGWERMRDAVGSPGGWRIGLAALANLLARS